MITTKYRLIKFWLNLQVRHDQEVAKDRLGDRLQSEVKVWAHS